jgi:hypothetical protein
MFYGDALDALRIIKIEIHDLHEKNVRETWQKENQMFYEPVSGVFYCTTSSLLIHSFIYGVGIIKNLFFI